jgi:hypothetical protein
MLSSGNSDSIIDRDTKYSNKVPFPAIFIRSIRYKEY